MNKPSKKSKRDSSKEELETEMPEYSYAETDPYSPIPPDTIVYDGETIESDSDEDIPEAYVDYRDRLFHQPEPSTAIITGSRVEIKRGLYIPDTIQTLPAIRCDHCFKPMDVVHAKYIEIHGGRTVDEVFADPKFNVRLCCKRTLMTDRASSMAKQYFNPDLEAGRIDIETAKKEGTYGLWEGHMKIAHAEIESETIFVDDDDGNLEDSGNVLWKGIIDGDVVATYIAPKGVKVVKWLTIPLPVIAKSNITKVKRDDESVIYVPRIAGHHNLSQNGVHVDVPVTPYSAFKGMLKTRRTITTTK